MSFAATLALDCGLSIWAAMAARQRQFARHGGLRFGACARSLACCWPHWSRASQLRPMPPTTSTGWRPTASWQTFSPCRWSRLSLCRWEFSASLSMPFGFDGVFWHLMGEGIDWMVWVAQWVGNLPGAVGRMRAFGTGPLLAGTAGLLLICLLRTPLRLGGAALLVGASLWAIASPQPDVLDCRTMARLLPFVGPMADFPFCAAAETASPSRNGLPPTRTRERRKTQA